MLNSLFTATETLQIEHVVHQVFTKGIESNKTGKACALTSLLKKVFVLPFFFKSSTLSINFSTFCQHCQIAEN